MIGVFLFLLFWIKRASKQENFFKKLGEKLEEISCPEKRFFYIYQSFWRRLCVYSLILLLIFNPSTTLAIHHIAFSQFESTDVGNNTTIRVKYWKDLSPQCLKKGEYLKTSPEFEGSWTFGVGRGGGLIFPGMIDIPFENDAYQKDKSRLPLRLKLNEFGDAFNFYLYKNGNVELKKVKSRKGRSSFSIETFGDLFIPATLQKSNSPELGLIAKNIQVQSCINTRACPHFNLIQIKEQER